MPTPRKRTPSSGFNKKEEAPVLKEEPVKEIEEIEEVEKPFVPEKIVPTELVERKPEPPPVVETPQPPTPGISLNPPPKRHPRNVPKFSRYN